MSSTPDMCCGWFATTPDRTPGDPGEPDDQVLGVPGLDLEEVAVVDQQADHLADVVALLPVDRDDVAQGRVRLHHLIGLDDRRILGVVLRQEAEQLLRDQDRLLVVIGHEVRHPPGQRHVGVGAAQGVLGHLLAGDLLDHSGPGDEHVGLPGLDDEVGQRRGVRRTPPAHGPAMIDTCGTTPPDSNTLL